MKQLQGIGGGVLAGAAIALITQTPALAQTRVQEVRLVEMNGEVSLLLTTQGGERPEVFVVRRGNDFVADIINTQLAIPDQNFQQSNPVPGIASVVVTQLDPTSVRVIVSGANGAPEARIMQGASGGIVIAMGTRAGNNNVAQAPANQPVTPPAPPPATPTQPLQNGNQSVLVPDPAVTIDGRNVPPGGIRPMDQAPPFLPRAVAPPVGDIAVAGVDTSTSTIRLDSSQRIPRLVLRDAPVRDVLALLARTAGLNVAFLDGPPGDQQSGQNTQQGSTSTNGPKISLDIENESIEDVFNYVLRLSGLESNRVGNTIFVGTRLPIGASNVIVRTLRLNQVPVENAAAFLSTQGAETQIRVDRIRIEQVGQGFNARTIEVREPTITALGAQASSGPLVLRGLSVSTDSRLNAITLVGDPRKVEIAMSLLTQLDLRQRQVAVNVKVIDVNLSGEEATNSSFSFGINNTFFVNDGGAATVNFNGINPPNSDLVRNGVNARPIIVNQTNDGQVLGDQDAFFDPDQTAITPLTAPGGGIGLLPIAPVTERPNQVGISEYDPFERDLDTGRVTEVGEAAFQTFPFFQYPRRFLATLQAEIVSRNAKILTDPTLVVQEGETATVQLVESVVRRITTQFVDTGGTQRETQTPEFGDVGLTLAVNVQRVDDNGFVTLVVEPTISSLGDRIETGNGGFATEILVRSVSSGRIRLRDGQTLILSGIIQENERVTANKIPILGDLPLIGSLFRSSTKANERAEVIVLLTPQILDDSDRSPYGYEYNPSPDSLRMMQGR